MKIYNIRRLLQRINLPLYNKLFALEYAFYRRNAIRKANKKEKLNVLFMVMEAGMWKYDSLYEAMLADARFNPILCIVPHNHTTHTEEYIIDNINALIKLFGSKSYEYQLCYDVNTREYANIRDFNPDILIYLKPYDSLIELAYHFSKYKEILTCYIDYSFCITNESFNYDEPIQITAWRNFVPSEYHKTLVKKYAHINRNVVVSGYPVYDMFSKALSHKNTKIHRKTIIWAPHQSIFPITGKEHAAVRWSTFLLYSETMLSIAKQHEKDLYFIFRPHPDLKFNLYKHEDWGREKTDAYYRQWEELPNAEISLTNYVEQFCNSDALIHDGGGFMAEYLYTQNPCLYLSNYIDEYISQRKFNDIGIAAWKAHYHAYSEADIRSFIEDVVINGKDSKKDERMDVLEKYVLPPNNQSVADNIIRELKQSIYGNK